MHLLWTETHGTHLPQPGKAPCPKLRAAETLVPYSGSLRPLQNEEQNKHNKHIPIRNTAKEPWATHKQHQ